MPPRSTAQAIAGSWTCREGLRHLPVNRPTAWATVGSRSCLGADRAGEARLPPRPTALAVAGSRTHGEGCRHLPAYRPITQAMAGNGSWGKGAWEVCGEGGGDWVAVEWLSPRPTARAGAGSRLCQGAQPPPRSTAWQHAAGFHQ